ncbi:hypothetical protein THAOC_37199, partial [Thalassiosira oceanica]
RDSPRIEIENAESKLALGEDEECVSPQTPKRERLRFLWRGKAGWLDLEESRLVIFRDELVDSIRTVHLDEGSAGDSVNTVETFTLVRYCNVDFFVPAKVNPIMKSDDKRLRRRSAMISRAEEMFFETKTREDGSVDSVTVNFLGDQYSNGWLGLEKDMARAVELWTEAAAIGSADACFGLGLAYGIGDGVEQDVARGVSFYEKAAMLGNSAARHNLGCYEYDRGRYDRAARHFLISAKMGSEKSLANIKELFKEGLATKTQYAEALKGCRDALAEMKSPDRKEAETSPLFNQMS